MTVYLDLVMVLNFLVDLLLLLGTNRLAGFSAGFGRCVMAAVCGGVYSGICLLPGFSFLGSSLWRLVSLGLMSLLAFGMNGSALRRGGIFVILSMALGGIALSMGTSDFLPLLGCGIVLLGLCHIGFGDAAGGRNYVAVTIYYQDQVVSVIALQDSGNMLRDPITGEQVLVLSARVAGKLTGLSEEQIRRPLETLASRQLPGLRLIPYKTVGCGGMLLAMRFEKVKIGDKLQPAVVAFAAEDFGRGESYQALTGGVV